MRRMIYFFLSQAAFCAGAYAQGQEGLPGRGSPQALPDISVTGVIDGHISDDNGDADRNKLEFREIETAFQDYLYPEIKADVFLALHKHDAGYDGEICEAKVSFLRLAPGLSAEAGKVTVEFGKLNKSHSHTRAMIDQPAALTNFLGEHAFNPQGAALKYLLPLPFYAQLQGGAWQGNKHDHPVDGESTAEVLDTDLNTVSVVLAPGESGEFFPADKIYTGRFNTAFQLSAGTELEIGTSFLSGKGAHFEEHKDRMKLAGADITLKLWPSAYRRLTLQGEYFHLARSVPAGELKRDGLYVLADYRLSRYWELGARFDYAENAFPAVTFERDYSLIVTRRLTETTSVRAQYKYRDLSGDKANEGWLQLVFGLGPHTHELE